MAKAKILLVDDDQMLVEMYKERLLASNYDVVVAHNGQEALEVVGKVQPDLILLDLMMPKVNGYDVLHELKTRSETRNIPVVILTALIQETNKVRGMEAGADDYLIKSETMPGQVIEKVQAVLAKKAHKG